MDKNALENRLRQARLKKGYTLHFLAVQAGIGEVYLGEIERGLKMPSMNIFIKLIEALDVSADYLLRNELTSGCAYIFDEITDKLKNIERQGDCFLNGLSIPVQQKRHTPDGVRLFRYILPHCFIVPAFAGTMGISHGAKKCPPDTFFRTTVRSLLSIPVRQKRHTPDGVCLFW